MDVIVVLQQPVDIRHAAAPRINAPHRPGTFVLLECQRLCRGLYQRSQGTRELRGAPKEAIDDDFSVTKIKPVFFAVNSIS